ncbi:MAG: TraR/DksA family transcriptional regulator [Pirellulaceae bacterium]|nr:TraR/DksA family transcriptional regulator [Pirellulaceae bacterium]
MNGIHKETKAKLEQKLAQLVARVEEIDADLSDEPDDDWQDRATDVEGDEALSSIGNATNEEIKQIRHALHLIETGKYGVCTRCGAAIAKERLEAVPYAATCMSCK